MLNAPIKSEQKAESQDVMKVRERTSPLQRSA